MNKSKRIKDIIYQYYPQNYNWGTDYINSLEYRKQLQVRKNMQENVERKGKITKLLAQIFKRFMVVDWSNIEEYNCYEFRILIHQDQPIWDDDIQLIKKLNGVRYDLMLFISILEKYYHFFFVETTFDERKKDTWSFRRFFECPDHIVSLVDVMNTKLKKDGYCELSYKDVNEVVDDVETELLNRGEVKVFSCLFTDLYPYEDL
ncbi:hypothetical protein IC619_005625 [Hazenella sp. IB182353]|uniref:hypothetical protein n=1 Tax=Polycladospora coralii TaxID=2771432 RepID=UPI001746D99D|nr:hypothetical protein [Polycladospora coralii]MBS7529977.1 hypothetical protein [Polycladospora coralii]